MWTAGSDLSDCWLNTPDVRTADDDDLGPPWTAAASVADQHHDVDLLDNLGATSAAAVVADPAGPSFHRDDVTFHSVDGGGGPLSPAIPLPVLQFHDDAAEAALEQRLVTPPVLSKAVRPELVATGYSSVMELGSVRSDDDGPASGAGFASPLSESRLQERFVLIQLPLDAEQLISILSRATNNNELAVGDSTSSSDIHRRRVCQQQQQQQQPASQYQVLPASDTAVPCSEDRRLRASACKTGSDVTRMSEEDMLRLLDDAESIMVYSPTLLLTSRF